MEHNRRNTDSGNCDPIEPYTKQSSNKEKDGTTGIAVFVWISQGKQNGNTTDPDTYTKENLRINWSSQQILARREFVGHSIFLSSYVMESFCQFYTPAHGGGFII